jgi:hypothetical protein
VGVKEKLTAIADKIRTKTRKTDGLDLDEMAQGVDEVFEAGKKAEYDAFWDEFQDKGAAVYCTSRFAGNGWTDNTFKPKYNINPTNVTDMFREARIVDLKQCLSDCGVTLDLSKAHTVTNMCSYATTMETFPKVDFSSAKQATNCFYQCSKLKVIDELVSHENLVFDRTFYNCSALIKLLISGVIAKNGFNVQWATKLDKESITSIVNALSSTASGLSVTLSKAAVNTAFETSAGAANGSTSTEWTTLAGTKTNWTINLV